MLTRRRAKVALLFAAAASLAACSSDEPRPAPLNDDSDDASSHIAPESQDIAVARLETDARRDLARGFA